MNKVDWNIIKLYYEVNSDHNSGPHEVNPLLAYILDKYKVEEIYDTKGNYLNYFSDIFELNEGLLKNPDDENFNYSFVIEGVKKPIFTFEDEYKSVLSDPDYESPINKWYKDIEDAGTQYTDDVERACDVDHYELWDSDNDKYSQISVEDANKYIFKAGMGTGWNGADTPEMYWESFDYNVYVQNDEIRLVDNEAWIFRGRENVKYYQQHSDSFWVVDGTPDLQLNIETGVYAVMQDGSKKQVILQTCTVEPPTIEE